MKLCMQLNIFIKRSRNYFSIILRILLKMLVSAPIFVR